MYKIMVYIALLLATGCRDGRGAHQKVEPQNGECSQKLLQPILNKLSNEDLFSLATNCWESNLEAQDWVSKGKYHVITNQITIHEDHDGFLVNLPFNTYPKRFILIHVQHCGATKYVGSLIE